MSGDHWVGPDSAPDTFNLVSVLGGGGEGEVWQAVLPLSAGGRRSVAVKIMPAVGDAEEPRRFDRFGHLLRALSHPGLVRVTDVFVGPAMHRAGNHGAGRRLYVVMDHVEGPTLRDWVVDHPDTPAGQRLRMLRMTAAALDTMHSGATTEVPVAHGDVKPANIVVRSDGATVLVDLGLTRLADGVGVAGHSVPYAAPELRSGPSLPTPEADRFAFAVTVAQVLTGAPPPLGPDGWLDVRALDSLLRQHPVTARRHLLVQQILAVVTAPPEHRPRELRRWLDGAVESLSQVTDAPAGQVDDPERTVRLDRSTERLPAPSSPPRRRRRRRLPLVLAAVVVVGGAGTAGVMTLGSLRTPAVAPPAAVAAPTAAPAVVPSTTPTITAAPTTDVLAADGSTIPGGLDTDTVAAGETVDVGPAYLAARPIVESDRTAVNGSYRIGTEALNGTTYTRAVRLDAGCGNHDGGDYWVDYDLGRRWSSLHTVAGLSDDSSATAQGTWTVLTDGKPVASGNLVLGKSTPLDVPVTGVLRVRLLIHNPLSTGCTGSRTHAVWGDPQLS